MIRRAVLFSLLGLCAAWSAARAQTDEIQVYDATIEGVGQLGETLHNNYTPIGRRVADYPGGIVPNHAWNGVPEYAYGVTPWFEAGLYLPVYTIRNDGRAELDSAKLRALFVTPDAAQRTFFYGVNFELSYNAAHWEQSRLSGEIRPIVGWHLGPWDIILNPIVDTDYRGLGHLDFAPAERLAYNLSPIWTVAVEHYADFGRVSEFDALPNQAQTLFLVGDYRHGDAWNVEFGAGHGFTQGADDLVMKLMVTWEY